MKDPNQSFWQEIDAQVCRVKMMGRAGSVIAILMVAGMIYWLYTRGYL